MINKKRGFTLIELLVVIAIIGILSSIVLASLNSARNKGNDAKIKSQLANARAAAEIHYTSVGSYSATAACAEMIADTASGFGPLATAANYPAPANTTLVCNSSATAWAMSAQLSTNQYWCADSTGASKEEAAVLGAAVVCS